MVNREPSGEVHIPEPPPVIELPQGNYYMIREDNELPKRHASEIEYHYPLSNFFLIPQSRWNHIAGNISTKSDRLNFMHTLINDTSPKIEQPLHVGSLHMHIKERALQNRHTDLELQLHLHAMIVKEHPPEYIEPWKKLTTGNREELHYLRGLVVEAMNHGMSSFHQFVSDNNQEGKLLNTATVDGKQVPTDAILMNFFAVTDTSAKKVLDILYPRSYALIPDPDRKSELQSRYLYGYLYFPQQDLPDLKSFLRN